MGAYWRQQPITIKQRNLIGLIERVLHVDFLGNNRGGASDFIGMYKPELEGKGVKPRPFSPWVYTWYKLTYFGDPASKYYVEKPYTDSDVLDAISDVVGYIPDTKSEAETALKDTLSTDEKLEYGLYESCDEDYLFDLLDNGDDVPGYRE